MKTNVRFGLNWLFAVILLFSSAVLLTNCKGHVEIFGITDSVQNCSPPFVVYFYPDAEHRTKGLEYTWTFGDGTESHDQEEIVHTYTEYGVYTVNLNIKQNKVEDNYTYTLYLTEDSTTVYSDWDYATLADSLWVPAYVEFQNYSEHATRFLWEFGDGSTSTTKSPTHVFENQGEHLCQLNAICNEDTSKFARHLFIKPPPKQILVNEIAVWLPEEFNADYLYVEVYFYTDFDNTYHFEKKSDVVYGFTSLPITFPLALNLYGFLGDYNSDKIVFNILSNPDDPYLIWQFGVETRDLQLDYYPRIIDDNNGNGIAYEALMQYRD